MVVIFVVLFAIFSGSTFFLQEYYIYRQKNEFAGIYNQISNIAGENKNDVMVELSAISSKMNINMVVCDSTFTEIYASTNMLNNSSNLQSMSGILKRLHKEVDINPDKGYGMMTFTVDNAGDMLVLEGILKEDYYVFLLKPMVPMIRSVSIYRDFILYISIIVAIISAIAAYFISSSFTKPIKELVDISEKISKLDFSKKYEPKSVSEINQLGLSLNTMSEKLSENIVQLYRANTTLKNDITQKERNEEMRKEFLQNASHELKTPISVIASYSEMLKEKMITDEEDREYYYNVIYDETEKMAKIVKELLMLAQFESYSDMLSIESFNLTELVEDVIATYEIIAQKENIEIISDIQNDVFASADMLMIERVISNYISNAIYHAEDDNKIHVGLKASGEGIIFSVKNKTSAVLDNKKIWSSFYKGQNSSGNGLGLSIVKAVMEAHNKKYGVTCSGGYAEFYFIL